jgi:N-acetylglutamate synthase-like GNAT family acetyltransferase
VDISIRPALPAESREIRRIHSDLHRPKRPVRVAEYLVATDSERVLGCAAVRMFPGGGYLYGLAVERKSQRSGIGSALTGARVDLIRAKGQSIAVVLAMFWNVKFFRNLGFIGVRRNELPSAVKRLSDFRNPAYKHSAVLWQKLAG